MDAEVSPASGEASATAGTATTATAQIPREGELTVISAAISEINERQGKMDARLEAFESQLHTPSVRHKRVAPKVASASVRNRFASLKNERAEKIRRDREKAHRLKTSGEDYAEASYTDPTENGMAVVVRSNVAATQHVTAQGGCEHTQVKILTREIGSSGSLFVMSAYCRPSQRQYEFERIVNKVKWLAETRPVLIFGDFNAAQTTWGHKFQSKNGKALAKVMEDHEMAFQNELDVTTRRGNNAASDTTPDLSWLWGTLDVSSRSEEVDLRSDHSVIGITIRGSRFRAVLGTVRMTD
ncbi:hypothetical protein V5799_006239 [Amblyomma americanum]|uniref:Endonuclease/exonuclease/phosphatase domain-containing protein n=1 Tax=Amblyomma americanum TaxID=6943 RepID=A0AAQ4DWY8_AMBAM